LGNIPKTREICGQLVVTNTTSGKIFLMRADASPGVKVYTSKKALSSGDTCLLVISIYPEKKGRFRENIRLITSESENPHEIEVSGNLLELEKNDRMACYYFGNRRPEKTVAGEPIFIPAPGVNEPAKTVTAEPRVTPNAPRVSSNPAAVSKPNVNELDREKYVPNNLVFLVDVSGSMKDSLKLPLMKRALHTLIEAVRDVDSITLITYADTIKILNEAVSGTLKQALQDTVNGLKARGLTRGRKAIEISQRIAQKHFIQGGNNMLFIVSDGKFKFDENDFRKWQSREGNRKVVITTIALGDEREALSNLRHIARKGEGSFIHITKSHDDNDRLLEEVKMRSAKKQ
jgi:Mg-chelatase subunit ChlD